IERAVDPPGQGHERLQRALALSFAQRTTDDGERHGPGGNEGRSRGEPALRRVCVRARQTCAPVHLRRRTVFVLPAFGWTVRYPLRGSERQRDSRRAGAAQAAQGELERLASRKQQGAADNHPPTKPDTSGERDG